MPLEKQSLNNFLPDGFETLNQEGYKVNFSEDKIKTGYEKDIKDRVSGPNLNNLIDVVGKNTNTLNNYVEYLNGIPINNVPTVNANGQLDYTNLDDKLTKKQITNCILEIPQRIKYTLENGTLTIKAGSVVIVPYGVEDLTSQYPVGSVFINDNFRVYDTQFEDDKFFVWAELVNDVVSNTSGSPTEEIQFMCMSLTLNTTGWQKNTESGTSATSSLKYTLYYNTNTNLVGITENTTTPNYTDKVFSFVFLTATNSTSNSWKSVNQVFNGMGYIGNVIWYDKGLKTLIPNGRNSDGTLNNIEFITDKLLLNNLNSWQSLDTTHCFLIENINAPLNVRGQHYYIQETEPKKEAFIQIWFNTANNTMYRKENAIDAEWVIKKVALLGFWYRSSSTSYIKSFASNQPFKSVDYNDVDGQWVVKNIILLANTNLDVETDYNYDLSDYLPNDGNLYEVIGRFVGRTGTSSGNRVNIGVITDKMPAFLSVCAGITRTSNYEPCSGNFITVVGVGRSITLSNGIGSIGKGYCDSFDIRAYRKVR